MTGWQLRGLRERAGLSQKAVAAKLSVSQQYICLVEQGLKPSDGISAAIVRVISELQQQKASVA